jgi:histidyl-tRNA synthetase
MSQFNQFGIELIGSRAAESGGWECDVEVIALGAQILKHLQLFPQYTAVHLFS